MELRADWSIPDGTGEAGQEFTLALPEPFSLNTGEFDLKGTGEDPLTYGTCSATDKLVTCTLNDNVVGKSQVRGTLTFNFSARQTYNSGSVEVAVNGPAKSVPLPTGNETGIGYDPNFPSDLGKTGWVESSDPMLVTWWIRIPGKDFTRYSTISVVDDFSVHGINLSLIPGEPTVYKLKATALCWNENTRPDCRTDFYPNKDANALADVTVDIDNAASTFTTTISLQAHVFEADYLYIVDVRLRATEEIPVGTELVNNAAVEGREISAVAKREMTGSGTGSGLAGTVGHISLKKNVTGGTFPDAVFPATYSYTDAKGVNQTGDLALKGDGTPVSLVNIPHGRP
ncbi:MAG: Ig-like domain-containing protein [Propionibacteriaceae bacterium]|nr:Ig-like domain-containing protein [Propionibacteriaceae bacterium]